MTSYLNDGDCVVQILACEQDPRRLFDDVSRHVAADRAKHAAVYEARVAVEAPNTGTHPQQDTPTRSSSTKLSSVYLDHSNLTLTLLHMDTTFRFNSARVTGSAPSLAWPTIHESFASGPFVDDDLLLRAQFHHPDASLKPGKQIVTPITSLSSLTQRRCSSWNPALARRDVRKFPRRRHLTRASKVVQGYAVLVVQTAPLFTRPRQIPQELRRRPQCTNARIRLPAYSRDHHSTTEQCLPPSHPRRLSR